MGFASGFGEAFSQSYGQASSQRASRLEQEKLLKARKEESEYEWRMKGLFDEKEKRTALEKKEREDQAQARVLAEQTGKPLKDVYARLKDAGYAATKDWAENTVGGPSTSPQGIDDQMAGSGMAAAESPVDRLLKTEGGEVPTASPEAPVNQPEASESTSMGGGYKPAPKVLTPEQQMASLQREFALSTTSPERKAAIETELKSFGQAKDFVDPPQAGTGRTKADLIAAVGAAPIGSPERLQAQANLDQYTQTEADQGILSGGEQLGTALDEKGNRVVVPVKPVRTENGIALVPRGANKPADGATVMGEDEKAAYNKFQDASSSNPAIVKQNERVIGLTGMLRSSARLQKIVQNDPNVLQDVTGTGVDILDSVRKEFESGISLLGVEMKKNGAGEVDGSSMEALQDKVDSIDVSAITDRAQLRDLFKAEMNLLVYRAGAALGQSGQAFSGKDFNLIAQGLKGSTSGPAFMDNLNSYMSGQIRSVEDGGQALSDYNAQLKQFANTYGYLPTPAMPSPGDFIASRSTDSDGNITDQELQDGYTAARRAKAYAGIDNGASVDSPNTTVKNNPNTPAGKTKSGVSWSIK